MEDLLITVDENDNALGVLDKLSVHQKGILHRAFSLFIFNSKGEFLLQRRAKDKYHSPGLWSNTCCSHPRDGETLSKAVVRRLMEEMGLECITQFEFKFIYRAAFENGLIEHELDHVYFGKSENLPKPNFEEVQGWRYISLEKLEQEIYFNPDNFSEWMKICLPKVKARLKQYLNNY